jgi:ubiquitin-conjugating enzyme E2 variant
MHCQTSPVNELLLIALQVIAVILLVDFFSGVFHWLEDSYGNEQTPFLGRFVITPNIIHHHKPRDLVRSPFWHRNIVTAILSAVIFSTIAIIFGTSWHLWLFCSLGALCNEFHCWAHRSPKENGPVIATLHSFQILQSPNHHAKHHANPKNKSYCLLTNYTNLLLDRIEFWRRAELFVVFIFSINPRSDYSLNTNLLDA